MTPTTVRTFVPRNERERLMVAFADLVLERGYACTDLTHLAHATGAPLAEIAALWSSEEECAIATLDACAERVFSRVAQTVMHTGADYPSAAHQGLRALLCDLAGMPAMVHLAVIELPHASAATRDRAERWFAQFAEFLGPAFAARETSTPDVELVRLMLGGGLLGVLRQHALERRVSQLPEALPAISYMCLSTFFGVDEARRVLRLDARPGNGLAAPARWAAPGSR